VDKLDMISAIVTIEMAMKKMGKDVLIGSGVKAVEESLLEADEK